MSSIRRIVSSRENGKLSRGPVTEEGKRRSSSNSTRHGLFAKCIVLQNESREGFDDLHQQHLDYLQPQAGLEVGFVERMVAADWKMRRLQALETKMLNDAISAQNPHLGQLSRLESAYSQLVGAEKYRLLQLQESRLDRTYHRQIRSLLLLRLQNPINEILTPEPLPPNQSLTLDQPGEPEIEPTL